MQIKSIEIDPLDLELQTALTVAYGSYPVLNYALIKVHSDEGIIGLGEASPDTEVTGETQASVIEALRAAAAFLPGMDPFNIEEIINLCLEKIPASPSAVAAIDMALYDLMGKHLDLPVYQLLGGKAREGIGLYPVIPLDEPQEMAANSLKFAQMGLTTMKVKLGTDPTEDLRRLEAIRDAAGGGIKLRLDINQGWKDAPTTLEAIGSLKGFNIEYIEQPVKDTDLEGLARVSAGTEIPIMADESCHNAADVFKIACMKAADLINIKLMKCGGIYQACKALAVAEAAGLPCILGSMGESSIGSMAGVHLVTAKAALTACEAIGPLFINNDPAEGFLVDMTKFQALPSDAAGLGVRLK